MTEVKNLKTQEIQRLYDEQALAYASQAASFYSWQYIEEPSWRRGLKGLDLLNIEVLDVACGNGRIIEYLIAQGVKPERITGVDISQRMLDLASEQIDEVKFVQADMLNLKFPSDSFDLITSALGFRYLDNDQLKIVLGSLYEILKTDGTFFYVEGHPIRSSQDHPEGYYTRGWSEEDCPWGARNPFFNRPLEDFINFTAGAGFRIISFDEMRVTESAKEADPIKYQQKLALPSRFGLRATK